MRTIAVLAALLTLLTGKLAVFHAEDEADRDKIHGSWTVSAGEKAGQRAPAEGLKDVRMTFSGGKFTWKTGEKVTEGTFSLDAAKTPREISMSAEGKKLAGIYRLEGDELTICVGIGDDRPTDFVSKAGAKTLLLVLKREKP
jgi:uncharacterized protein (TIGR03067 family)